MGEVGKAGRNSKDARGEWRRLRDEVARTGSRVKKIDEKVAWLWALLGSLPPPARPGGR